MKQLFLLLLLFSLSTISYSQVDIGVKSGMNIATTKDLIQYPKNRIGWYCGAFARIPIYKKFFFQPELLYSSKGHKTTDLAGGEEITLRLNYINTPILFGYYIDKKTSILIGTELGYLLSARGLLSNKVRFDQTDSYPKKIDLGLDIGIAYTIYKNFGIEIRYNYGFKHMYNTDANGIRRGESLGGNRVFQIGLHYRLPSS